MIDIVCFLRSCRCLSIKRPTFLKMNSSEGLPQPGITVYYYQKCGLPGEREKQHFSGTFTAEQLTVHVAQSLKITPLCFHLFSLATTDLSVWLSPNAEIKCSGTHGIEFIFRMRLRTPKVEHLAVDKEAFGYFYLQCRSDFVNECISTTSDEAVLLGQGFTDALCYALELNFNPQKLKPKRFIPSGIIVKNKFDQFVGKKRLCNNMQKWLREEREKTKRDSLSDIKLRYINGFLKITDQYLVERFHISVGDSTIHTVLIDIYRDDQPGIHVVHSAEAKVDIQDKVDYLCAIDDLYGLNVYVDTLTVEVLSEIPLRRLKFLSKTALESFVTLLSKYYQLTKNFHEFLCESYNSPMMEELKRANCHGPVRNDWVKNCLLKKHQEDGRYNYLLKQDNSHIGSYVLVYVPHENRNTVRFINIICLPSGTLQLSGSGNDTDTPQFPDITSLLRHYSSDGHLGVPLKMCVPPQSPDDSQLFLCRQPSADPDMTRERQSAVLKLVSYVDTSEDIGQGHFTTVRKGRLPNVGEVAVKQLIHKGNGTLLQDFQSAVQSTSFWLDAHIIKVHAVCLAPHFQVMLEHAPHGSLDAYLRDRHCRLRIRDLVHVAEDIAKALLYLERKETASGRGEVHGNIRCRNVLVCSHQPESRLVVKLADPGLLHYYNSLPLHHDVNCERFPWIAPECYNNNLWEVTIHSDRYAFGITMWELFSSGHRPYGQMTTEQIKDFVDEGRHLDAPAQCPPDFCHILHDCWQPQPSDRPSARIILRDIIRLSRSENNDDILEQPVLPPTRAETVSAGITSLGTMSAGLTSEGGMSAVQSNVGTMSTVNRHERGISAGTNSFAASPLDIPQDSLQVLRPDQLTLDTEQLGKGHYGNVYKGKLQCSITGSTRIVAVKCLHTAMYKRYLDEFEKEISIMQELSHDNIVEFIGYLPHRHSEHPMQLVMEFAESGCLSQYLRTHASITSQHLLTFCEEIAQGMQYLHSKSIIHCDLAARNVLVTSDVHLKISDFGLAQILPPDQDNYKCSYTKDIPTAWCAPQSLFGDRIFSRESDVWSYGITMWEIYSFGAKPSLYSSNGQLLSRDSDILDALHDGRRLKQPNKCPDDIYDLMKDCWHYDPKTRIRFDSVGGIIDMIHTMTSNMHI